MEPFKVGDVVQLKSGGPNMTIQDIGKYGLVPKNDNALCEWFDGKKRMDGVFEFAVLKLADIDDEGGSVRIGRRRF